MQAAGSFLFASNLAALSETIASKDYLVEGWPQNSSYQKEFLKKIEKALSPTAQAQETRQRAREIGRERAEKFTWETLFLSGTTYLFNMVSLSNANHYNSDRM